MALNVLYAKKENIYLVYVSKHNSNREKQVILWKMEKHETNLICMKKYVKYNYCKM